MTTHGITDFIEFPKMARLSRECVITEKIDGTNGQLNVIRRDALTPGMNPDSELFVHKGDEFLIMVGSRSRWLVPGSNTTDNYGFAAWVRDNGAELVKLGEGRHFGEWWGAGIQRRYGVPDKRFSLFNALRWVEVGQPQGDGQATAPACCRVVPILYRGPFDTGAIEIVMAHLKEVGSYAAQGFMDPEGVIVKHLASGTAFKKTLKDDESPKSLKT